MVLTTGSSRKSKHMASRQAGSSKTCEFARGSVRFDRHDLAKRLKRSDARAPGSADRAAGAARRPLEKSEEQKGKQAAESVDVSF
jgi:hypothetical protein